MRKIIFLISTLVGGILFGSQTLQIERVDYSAKEILDGGTLTISAIVIPTNKVEPKDCWGQLTSDDLSRVSIFLSTCKATRIDEGKYKIILKYAFPKVTV